MAGKLYTQEDYNKKAQGVAVPGLAEHSKRVESLSAPAPIQEVAPVIPEEEPSLLDATGAAFRTSNWAVGLFNDMENEYQPVDSSYRFQQHAEELRKDVPEEYWNRLVGPRSLAGAQQEKEAILSELKDKELLRKKGIVGAGLEVAALLADPVTLLSGYGEVYALANMTRKGMRLRNMVAGGLVGAGAALGQEAALQTVTHTRDAEDLIYSGLFGLGVGSVLGGVFKGSAKHEAAELLKERQALAKSIMDDMDLKLQAETPMEYLTREQAEELVQQGITTSGFARPKEAAKAEVLRADIAEMKAAQTEELAAIHAEHGIPKTQEETKLLEHKVAGINTTWNPMLEQAEAKLSALDARLGNNIDPVKRVEDMLKSNKAEADVHNKRIKDMQAKHTAATLEYNSLNVPDFDVYDELGVMTAEFVNGIKGQYKQIVQNDGSTSAMFIPWTGGATKKAGQFTDLVDKQVKVELTDRNSVVNYNIITGKSGIQRTTLGELFDHPELYAQMPALKDIEVVLTNGSIKKDGVKRSGGAYLHGEHRIVIHDVNNYVRYNDLDKILRHEVQHAIQDNEGFARGGSPSEMAMKRRVDARAEGKTDDRFDILDEDNRAYKNLAGEEEARRAEWGAYERQGKNGNPYRNTDIHSPGNLVVKRFDKGTKDASSIRGTAMSEDVAKDVLDANGNIVPKPVDLVQQAADLEATGVYKKLEDSKVGKMLLKLGFTDSAYMRAQKSPLSKMFGHSILSNGADGAAGAGSVAVEKFQHLKVMLSTFMPDLTASYKQFAHNNNISHWNLKQYYGEGMEKWNKEIRIEMETRRNAFRDGIEHSSTAAKEIQDAADALQRMADHSLNVAKVKGVRGFEDIPVMAGYVPLIWKGSALRKAEIATPGVTKKYEALLTTGYTEALGITTEDADKIAKAVIRRALHKDVGIDANPRALFSADSRNFLRQSLEEGTDMSQQNIDELFARIDARQGDKGMSSRAKRRTDIDLLVTDAEGLSLLDIVDNDIPTLFTRYASEMSGRAALAVKGITSEADWTRLRNTLIQEAAKHGDDFEKLKKIVDSTYDQLLGRPAGGGVNKNARRLMDMASAAVLNQIGFAQMAEWAPIMAAHGVAGMFEMMPAIREYRAALKAGTLSDDLLSELSVHTGRIGEEEMLFRPDIRLDDKLSDDPAWLRILDKGLGTVNNVSGKLSMMHQIKTMQQQFVVALQANKVAKALKNITFTDAGMQVVGKNHLSRFAELGWDAKFLKDLKDVSKHFEFDERGTLQRLNIQEWKNPELTEKFVRGLHVHTNQMIQMPFIGETAYWMHSTVGAMLTQFRNFPLVAMEKQTARHMLMADEEAVFTAMYGLGLSALVYTAKVGLNAQGKGSGKSEYLDSRLSASAIAKGALQYANIAGPIQDVTNLAVAAGLAPKFMSSSNVGRQGGDKQANLSLADIPSLGTGLKAFNAATGIGKGLLNPDYNYNKKDLANIQGAMPLGNTPFLTIPWNAAKDEIE